MNESAEAATPPLVWRDVAAVRVQCLVVTDAGVDHDLRRRICDRVRDIAAAGAPAPVTVIELGDPALLAADGVTVLVHVSIQRTGTGRLAALAVRPFRNDTDQTGPIFGATPRATALPASGDDAAALDNPLRAALAEILPWLAAPAGARPINS